MNGFSPELFDPASFFGGVLAPIEHPVVRERVAVVLAQPLGAAALVSVALLVARLASQPLLTALVSVVALASLAAKASSGYSYDLPIAFASIGFDALLAMVILAALGAAVARKSGWAPASGLEHLGFGTAVFTLAALIAVTLGAQRLLRPNLFILVHVLACLWFIARLRAMNLTLHSVRSRSLMVLVALLPFLPYLGAAAPPDADVVSLGDMLGFVFQGQYLTHVSPWGPGEWYSVRYPAGAVGLGWGIGAIAGLTGSDVLIQLWLLAFLLLVAAMVSLGRRFGVPDLVMGVLCLNPVVTGPFGLHGGQIPEMLAYALGVFAVAAILRAERVVPVILASASALVHPVVALPFVALAGTAAGIALLKGRCRRADVLVIALLVCLVASYFWWIGRGPALSDSSLRVVLQDWSPAVFLVDVVRHFTSDSLGLWPLVLAGGVAMCCRDATAGWMMLWLALALGLDGIFGDTRWAARFHANFSTIGVTLIVLGWGVVEVRQRILARWSDSWAFGVFALAWMGAVGGRFFPLRPASVFSSHSTVRLGKYVGAIASPDARIANVRPPPGRVEAPMMGSVSSHR